MRAPLPRELALCHAGQPGRVLEVLQQHGHTVGQLARQHAATRSRDVMESMVCAPLGSACAKKAVGNRTAEFYGMGRLSSSAELTISRTQTALVRRRLPSPEAIML